MQASKDSNCDVHLAWYWRLVNDFVDIPTQAKITSYFKAIESKKEDRKRQPKKPQSDDTPSNTQQSVGGGTSSGR